MEEFLCNSCEETFTIISESNDKPEFCPFCGETDLINSLEEDFDFEDEE